MLRFIFLCGLIVLLSGVCRIEATNNKSDWLNDLPYSLCDKNSNKIRWGITLDIRENPSIKRLLYKGIYVVRYAELPYSEAPKNQMVRLGMQMLHQEDLFCYATLHIKTLSSLIFRSLPSKNYRKLGNVFALGDIYEDKVVVAFSEGLSTQAENQEGLNLLYTMVPASRYNRKKTDFIIPFDINPSKVEQAGKKIHLEDVESFLKASSLKSKNCLDLILKSSWLRKQQINLECKRICKDNTHLISQSSLLKKKRNDLRNQIFFNQDNINILVMDIKLIDELIRLITTKRSEVDLEKASNSNHKEQQDFIYRLMPSIIISLDFNQFISLKNSNKWTLINRFGLLHENEIDLEGVDKHVILRQYNYTHHKDWNTLKILHGYHDINRGKKIKEIDLCFSPYNECKIGWQAAIPFLLKKENTDIVPFQGYAFRLKPMSLKTSLLKTLAKENIHINKGTPPEAKEPNCFFDQTFYFRNNYLSRINDIDEGDASFEFKNVSYDKGVSSLHAKIYPVFGIMIPPHFFSVFSDCKASLNVERKEKNKRITYDEDMGLTCDKQIKGKPKYFIESVIKKDINGQLKFFMLHNGIMHPFDDKYQHDLCIFDNSENQVLSYQENLLVKADYSLSMVYDPGAENKNICIAFLVSTRYDQLPFTSSDLNIIERFNQVMEKNLKELETNDEEQH